MLFISFSDDEPISCKLPTCGVRGWRLIFGDIYMEHTTKAPKRLAYYCTRPFVGPVAYVHLEDQLPAQQQGLLPTSKPRVGCLRPSIRPVAFAHL